MQFRPRPASSLEYVRVDITARSEGLPLDPTADTVQMAFTLDGAVPTSSDWNVAIWQTDTTTTPPTYTALCLVGPGGTVELAEGEWSVWVKVTDSPEVPVVPINGLLTVL